MELLPYRTTTVETPVGETSVGKVIDTEVSSLRSLSLLKFNEFSYLDRIYVASRSCDRKFFYF